jgi:hypothetical protein
MGNYDVIAVGNYVIAERSQLGMFWLILFIGIVRTRRAINGRQSVP